jgi:hypothetical protein
MTRLTPAIVLCDRGTIDGLAYWPGPSEEFWSSLGTTLEIELGRCDAVIHLRTPAEEQGYNHQNPLRTESAGAAAGIDGRIVRAWERHLGDSLSSRQPSSSTRPHGRSILRGELPECCQRHVIPALRDHWRSAGPDVGHTSSA